jgi:hypothetical protein
MDFNKWGGRRFLFAIGLTTLCAFLLYVGKLTSSDFTSIVNINILALVAGHSADKFAKKGPENG